MYLPSKFTSSEQALISVGGQILKALQQPRNISATWEAVKIWRRSQGIQSPLPFWWFSLALDALFALGVVTFENGLLVRSTNA